MSAAFLLIIKTMASDYSTVCLFWCQEFGLQSVLSNIQTCHTLIQQHGGITRNHVVSRIPHPENSTEVEATQQDLEDQRLDDDDSEDDEISQHLRDSNIVADRFFKKIDRISKGNV
jgi:hypothetical protein